MNATIQRGDVVVAADGSDHADRAVLWAAAQAAAEHRRLVVVSIGEESVRRTNSDAVERAREAAPEVEVVAMTAHGDPRIVLVELSQHAHLLVVGSRGRGAVRSLLLGSVSATVVRMALCPVVVCRPRPAGHGDKGVIVGIDGTPASLVVLEFGFEQASLRSQALTVVHCVWDVVAAVEGRRNVAIEDADLGAQDEGHLLVAEAVAGFSEKYPDVPVVRRVMHGLVDDVLGGRTADWDLLVVGRHPLDTADRLVTGALATAIVEHARTTVAVVPAPRIPQVCGRPADGG